MATLCAFAELMSGPSPAACPPLASVRELLRDLYDACRADGHRGPVRVVLAWSDGAELVVNSPRVGCQPHGDDMDGTRVAYSRPVARAATSR